MTSAEFRAGADRLCAALDIFNEKLLKFLLCATFLLSGASFGLLLSNGFNLSSQPIVWARDLIPLALGAAFGEAVRAPAISFIKFFRARFSLVIEITGLVLSILILAFLIKLSHVIDISKAPDEIQSIFVGLFLIFLVLCLFSIYELPSSLKRLFSDKDQQAHLLFVASMAALGWGLWLQNGGNWQGMAVMNAPIVVPLVHWEIPFTESVALPFALFGFVHDPVGSAVSTVAHASLNTTLALFSGAAVLFFFAVNRLQFSVVGVRPEQAWLAFALGCAATYLDVALHWAGAPVLHPALILFNRTVAVLALGVYLFWRTDAKRGLPVPGVTNEYKTAFDMADQSAWKIAAWLLGLLWAATQFSHGFGGEFPEWVKTVLIGLLVAFPVRDAVKFNSEFRNALGRYNQLAALYQQSYKPPSTVATDAQIRDALNGGRGIGGQGIDGKGWHDTGD